MVLDIFTISSKKRKFLSRKEHYLILLTEVFLLILVSAENVNFKFTGTSPLEGVCLSKYPRNSKGAVLYRTMFITGIWIYMHTF